MIRILKTLSSLAILITSQCALASPYKVNFSGFGFGDAFTSRDGNGDIALTSITGGEEPGAYLLWGRWVGSKYVLAEIALRSDVLADPANRSGSGLSTREGAGFTTEARIWDKSFILSYLHTRGSGVLRLEDVSNSNGQVFEFARADYSIWSDIGERFENAKSFVPGYPFDPQSNFELSDLSINLLNDHLDQMDFGYSPELRGTKLLFPFKAHPSDLARGSIPQDLRSLEQENFAFVLPESSVAKGLEGLQLLVVRQDELIAEFPLESSRHNPKLIEFSVRSRFRVHSAVKSHRLTFDRQRLELALRQADQIRSRVYRGIKVLTPRDLYFQFEARDFRSSSSMSQRPPGVFLNMRFIHPDNFLGPANRAPFNDADWMHPFFPKNVATSCGSNFAAP